MYSRIYLLHIYRHLAKGAQFADYESKNLPGSFPCLVLFSLPSILPILSTMICSHSGWLSIHMVAFKNKSPTVLLLLFVEQCKKLTNLENPSISPWITNPQLTRLWWPSKCQWLFGPATEYAHLDTVIAQRILTLWGPTRARHLRTRSRCIIYPSDLKWPKTTEEPAKQPSSLRNALTLLSNCSSVTSLKRGVVETKLEYSAVNCPAWDKQHASDIFPTETQRTELNQCLFLYIIFGPSNLSINYSIWWRKWQNSYLRASCSTGKFTPSTAVPKHQLKIRGHFENCFSGGVWSYKWRWILQSLECIFQSNS